MGRKKLPHYRIVVADSRSPRDGAFVETLGYYKPLAQPARLVLDLERVDHWIGEGASPSGTVKSLISKARRGGDGKVAVGEVDAEARQAKRAEELAVRRAAEAKAVKEAAEAKAAETKAAAAAAEAEAVAESEPSAEAGADAEAEGAAEEEKSE
jgi:small subunit ribosomal protein S16